jgi:transcriptional regulator with XRE-family HTH domain
VQEPEAQKTVKEVIEALKERREALGWSQRALAEEAGVDPKTISLIEREMRSPTLFTLLLLAGALDCPLWKILSEAEKSLNHKA